MKRPSSTKPLREYTFFTDRDLGRQFPEALRSAGLRVEQHDNHFGPLTPDTEWLRKVGQQGWVALSHDQQIRYNTEERDMAMRAGVSLVLLVGKATHADLAANFLQTGGRIESFLATHQPPFIARLYRPSPVETVALGRLGRIELWMTYAEWLKAVRRKR